jgi:hypothetical protein
MTDIKKLLESKTNLKKSSIDSYANHVNFILKKLDSTDTKSLNNFDEVIAIIAEKAPATRKAYLNSVIVLMKTTGASADADVLKQYQELRDQLNTDYFTEKSTNLKNDKEQANMLTDEEWSHVINTLNKRITSQSLRTKEHLNKTEFNTMLSYLIVNLYKEFPLRNDFALMKIVNSSDFKKAGASSDFMNNNYLVLSARGAKFVINNYKTNGAYGSKEKEIPPNILRIIRQFLKISPNKQVLIVNNEGTPMSKNLTGKFISKTFQDILKKPVGIQMLRKSYLSNKYGNTLEEMKSDSDLMGHSLATQQGIYIKTD